MLSTFRWNKKLKPISNESTPLTKYHHSWLSGEEFKWSVITFHTFWGISACEAPRFSMQDTAGKSKWGDLETWNEIGSKTTQGSHPSKHPWGKTHPSTHGAKCIQLVFKLYCFAWRLHWRGVHCSVHDTGGCCFKCKMQAESNGLKTFKLMLT